MNVMYKSVGHHGYAVEFSPYVAHRLAVVCCQNYGISGFGSIHFVDVSPDGRTHLLKAYEWLDALFDLTWSESNAHVVVTAAGDGSVLAWDLNAHKDPVHIWKEHSKEVYGVDWNLGRETNAFLSASWDASIKLWDIGHPTSLRTYLGHENVVYSAIWSPLLPNCFASTSGDQTLRVWDTRSSHVSQVFLAGHVTEVLSCDWCKYNPNIIASGSTDSCIRVWDLRKPRQCLHELRGHQYAVRRVKFSPFDADILLSCSYDCTVRTWNFATRPTPLETIRHHSEFVYGIDFNLHVRNQVADCSWDEIVRVYSPAFLAVPKSLL